MEFILSASLETRGCSTGLSLRVNLLGAMIIEAYYALPWRGDRFEKGAFGLNFAPGW
jgi:hypothetical protein